MNTPTKEAEPCYVLAYTSLTITAVLKAQVPTAAGIRFDVHVSNQNDKSVNIVGKGWRCTDSNFGDEFVVEVGNDPETRFHVTLEDARLFALAAQ